MLSFLLYSLFEVRKPRNKQIIYKFCFSLSVALFSKKRKKFKLVDQVIRQISIFLQAISVVPIELHGLCCMLALEGFVDIDGSVGRGGNMRNAVNKKAGVFNLELFKSVIDSGESSFNLLDLVVCL